MSNFKYQININNYIKKIENFWQSQAGFTLIEILVVFAVTSVILISSMAAFSSYGRSQTFNSTVADIQQALNLLKSNSISYVKPSQCGPSQALDGYQFWYPVLGTYYRLSVRCGGTYYVLLRKDLPSGITFGPTATTTTFFKVSTGTIDSQNTMTIQGYGNSKVITIDKTGVISVQ